MKIQILGFGIGCWIRTARSMYWFPCPQKEQSYTYQVQLKKGAQQSHLGRQEMGWFLADQPVHQVKLKYETK